MVGSRGDVDPFEAQEPWVYETSSADRPLMELTRADVAVLERARGLVEDALGDGSAAVRSVNMLATLDLDHPQASAALRSAEMLARDGAEPWRVHLWCAQLAHACGQVEECTRRLALVEQSGPDALARTHLIARLARRRGELERAGRLAAQLVERQPTLAHGHAELGWVALANGERDDAHRHFARAESLASGDEVLMRQLNEAAPHLLTTAAGSRDVQLDGRCAVLLPGHLRRLDASLEFLCQLGRHVDFFVCTNDEYKVEADRLAAEAGATVFIVEDDPAARALEDAAPVGSMKQWLKLKLCIEMMLERELRDGFHYRHLLKLRTDYYLLDPGGLLDLFYDDGGRALFARSDKVFGGRRELVLPLVGLFRAMGGLFLDRERAWWPLDVGQVLRSSDSFKWYGMNLPRRVVGDCRTVRRLRERVAEHRDALQAYRPRRFDRFVRLFLGHPRMASEVCFARFLNLVGVPVADSSGLAGFLLADRAEGGLT